MVYGTMDKTGGSVMNYAMLVLNKDGEVIFDTGPYDGDCEEAGRSMKLAKARWEKRGYEVEFRERRKE